MRIVTLQEEMLVEGTRSLTTDTSTEAITIVVREHAGDRTDIELAGLSSLGGLDIVLEECFDNKQRNTHGFRLRHLFHKAVQATLLLGKLDGTILIPELLVLVSRVGHMYDLCLITEKTLLERRKVIIGKASVSHHKELLRQKRHLGPHIVRRQHPLIIRQLAVYLVYM